jgi:hypothetical protein
VKIGDAWNWLRVMFNDKFCYYSVQHLCSATTEPQTAQQGQL